MTDLQRELLRWASAQPALTGALILIAGAVYAFFGFRVFRALLALTCAALGWFVGAVAAIVGDLPAEVLGPLGALALGGLSVQWETSAVIVASSSTWAVLGYYLASQVQIGPAGAALAGAVTGLLGALFACLCYRTTRVILTTMQGAVLMVIGFVALTTRVLPAIGITFRQWANTQALLVPVFLIMLFVAAFSYQRMHQQGDIRTGH